MAVTPTVSDTRAPQMSREKHVAAQVVGAEPVGCVLGPALGRRSPGSSGPGCGSTGRQDGQQRDQRHPAAGDPEAQPQPLLDGAGRDLVRVEGVEDLELGHLAVGDAA